MSLAIRRKNAPASKPVALPGLMISRECDSQVMAVLQGKDPVVMADRFADGHHAYVARVDGAPAAWGWAATRRAEIGELGARFDIPAGQRYLWNFVTLPAFRGRGIYPLLLNQIVTIESADADLFWIAYAPENRASAAGIHKAGFTTVATLSFDIDGRPAVRAIMAGAGGAAARLLGIAEADGSLAQCWRCVRAGRRMSACRSNDCSCDYQRPQVSCSSAAGQA